MNFTLLGQSNALGFGLTAANLPAFLQGAIAGVTIAGAPLQPGVNTGTAANPQAWGPEVMISKLWSLDNPGGSLDWTKVAKGSTFLAQQPGADWNPASPGELYSQGITAIGGRPMSAVFWVQGEQDATDPATAGAYGSNLASFISHLGTDVPGAPVILSQIDPGHILAYSDQVRAAEAAAGGVSSDGVTLQADQLHYDGWGQVVIGGQLYAAWNPTAKITSGTAGDDLIGGSRQDDQLSGGDGNDLIFSGPSGGGHDFAHGNAGNDSVYGGAGETWVYGGKGNDLLFGGGDHDLVYGDLDNDTVNGGDGVDWVRGGQGNDSVQGGAGDDWLSGDKGDDTLSGGAGADLFNFFAGGGQDRVIDWNAGDRVQIEDHTAYSVSYAGGDTILTLATGDAITIAGQTLAGSAWIIP